MQAFFYAPVLALSAGDSARGGAEPNKTPTITSSSAEPQRALLARLAPPRLFGNELSTQAVNGARPEAHLCRS